MPSFCIGCPFYIRDLLLEYCSTAFCNKVKKMLWTLVGKKLLNPYTLACLYSWILTVLNPLLPTLPLNSWANIIKKGEITFGVACSFRTYRIFNIGRFLFFIIYELLQIPPPVCDDLWFYFQPIQNMHSILYTFCWSCAFFSHIYGNISIIRSHELIVDCSIHARTP